jgi:2-keto-4-pentenoate hydratase
MTPSQRISAAADLLATAWRNHTRAAFPAELAPVDLDQGLAIQDALAKRLNFEPVGWKLALTSAAGQARAGFTHPFFGRMLKGWVQNSPATFPPGTFNLPLLESEIAFRMAAALPKRETNYAREEVLDAVDSAFIGVEIPDVRQAGEWPFPMPMLAADNGATAGYVIGPDIREWRSRDLNAIEVSLEVDGRHAGDNLTGDERTDAIAVLVWAANELARRGYPLRAGDIVTTGSATKPVRCDQGSAVARFEGIGEVRLTM